MAKDVVAVLDDAGVDRAVLVGNSIGGMIAMQTALDAPDRVVGNLILSSGTNLAASLPPEAGEAFANDFEGAFAGLLEGAVSAATKRDRPEVVEYADAVFRVADNFTRELFFANASDPNGVFNWDITDRLGEISQPTQILAGAEDMATPVELNQLLADRIPNAQIEIVDGIGHFYQLERPAGFNEALRSFLKRL
jgi:pimeloyl-ACP methyl ester carboxylesterase